MPTSGFNDKGAETQRHFPMKHIALETEDEQVKRFVLSLELDPEGSVLELHGKPVARVLPVNSKQASYDPEKLKAAILARRNESRRTNEDWADADRDVWQMLGGSQS
jgi:hypothetical protein